MEKESIIIRVNLFVRGYHAYMEIWEPDVNDENSLQCEPNNTADENAVAVVQLKIPSANQEPVHSSARRCTGAQTKLQILWRLLGTFQS